MCVIFTTALRPKTEAIAGQTYWRPFASAAFALGPPPDMWWLGVLIELIAVFCSALGKVLLRLAAVRSQPWFYVVGVLIAAVISPIFDLMAYGFAPTTLLTACGGMVVVFNVVLCPCILNERLTMQRALSAFLITVGTVGSSLFGSHDQTEQSQEDYMRLFVRPWSIVYYSLLLSWYALCVVLIRTSKDKEVQSAWLAALGGSCAGAFAQTTFHVWHRRTLWPLSPICSPPPQATRLRRKQESRCSRATRAHGPTAATAIRSESHSFGPCALGRFFGMGVGSSSWQSRCVCFLHCTP